jgi:hypothetical protein
MYRTSDGNDTDILDKTQDECCKLVNEFHSQRLVQIGAWVKYATNPRELQHHAKLSMSSLDPADLELVCTETLFQMLSTQLLVREASVGLRA